MAGDMAGDISRQCRCYLLCGLMALDQRSLLDWSLRPGYC